MRFQIQIWIFIVRLRTKAHWTWKSPTFPLSLFIRLWMGDPVCQWRKAASSADIIISFWKFNWTLAHGMHFNKSYRLMQLVFFSSEIYSHQVAIANSHQSCPVVNDSVVFVWLFGGMKENKKRNKHRNISFSEKYNLLHLVPPSTHLTPFKPVRLQLSPLWSFTLCARASKWDRMDFECKQSIFDYPAAIRCTARRSQIQVIRPYVRYWAHHSEDGGEKIALLQPLSFDRCSLDSVTSMLLFAVNSNVTLNLSRQIR